MIILEFRIYEFVASKIKVRDNFLIFDKKAIKITPNI